MNEDLEKTLDEMGAEYRAVVARLRNALEAGETRRRRQILPYLAAASLLAALCLSALLQPPSAAVRPRYGAREYHMSVGEMVATQNPDGSWQNDFLTRRNAAALRNCPDARVAYKKAVRYLAAKGLF